MSNDSGNMIAMSITKEKEGLQVDNVPSISLNIDSQKLEKVTNLSFHNICYTVQIKENLCGLCRSKKAKTILTNVSGIMKPGINAIMGPTGSGKSSLLDILAGRKDVSGLAGDVLINGSCLPSNFKRISGYVVQQDVVLGTLTVRENLWFSANLRLPRSMSYEKKKERVEEILYDLGLTGCADTKVGNALIRGVSGGEKKRACIGMELITAPAVLFLDEPTTGLDASTANAVMLLLKKLANRGRTIVLSIHQPRYSIYRLFDSLTLLSLGKLVYHGSYDEVLPYFESLGYHCQEHNNPADFFLDVINGDSTALANNLDNELESSSPDHPNPTQALMRNGAQGVDAVEKASANNDSLAQQLSDTFKKSSIYKNNQDELTGIDKEVAFSGHSDLPTYATPFYYQFVILSKRAFTSLIRNPLASVGNLVVNIFLGVLFGLLFYQIDDSPTAGTQNRFGVLFFFITNLLFSSISAVQIFNNRKDVFIHEYVSGYYMVISYFLSELIADLIPMRTIAPLVFGSVTYWMVGLKSDASAFFIFLFFLILIGYCATAIALFYSSSFETFSVANIFISITFVFTVVFAGLLLNVDTVLPWLSWIKYLSVAQYGFSALSINEFRDQVFTQCFPTGTPAASSCSIFTQATVSSTGNLTCCRLTGEDFIYERLGLGTGAVVTEWDLWQNAVALACIFVGMMALTYFQLTRTKTTT